MIGKIYLVYIERGKGYCGASAFVYDKKLNAFHRISSHMSSDLAWAKYDIRRHDDEYRLVFPDGYEFIDVGVFKKPFGEVDYSDVMEAISKAHDPEYGMCETCCSYEHLRKIGCCSGCKTSIGSDGRRHYSGWTPKQNLVITSFYGNDIDMEQD